MMTLIKKDLDKVRRSFMKKELLSDIEKRNFLKNEVLNHSGNMELPDLLMEAVTDGDEHSLADAMKRRQCMRVFDVVSSEKGVTLERVPDLRYHEFSKSTFDKIYLRSVCLEAIESGCDQIIVHDDSFERVYSSTKLLKALRNNTEVETIIGLKKVESRAFEIKMKY